MPSAASAPFPSPRVLPRSPAPHGASTFNTHHGPQPRTRHTIEEILSGNGRFGADGEAAQKDDTLWLERMQDGIETRVSITADTPLHVLLAAGTPLNEPVSAYGPFVMNTEADILQAIHDYRAGTFGQIPLNQEHSA